MKHNFTLPPMSPEELAIVEAQQAPQQQFELPPMQADELAVYQQQNSPHPGHPAFAPTEARLPFGKEDLSIFSRAAGDKLKDMLLGRPADALEATLGMAPIPFGQQLQQMFSPTVESAQQVAPFVSPEEMQTGAGQLGEFVGETLPFMAIPAARIAQAPKFVERAVAGASPAVKQAGLMAGRLGKGAAVGAPITAIANPDEDLGESSALGGAVGAGTSGALAGLGSIGKLTAKGAQKLFGGFGKPENIKRTQQAMQETGIDIPVGEILESPTLTSFQRLSGKLPFSGLSKVYKTAAGKVEDQAKKLIERMQKTGSSEAQEKMQQNLVSLSAKRNKVKRKLYGKVDTLAGSKGYKLESPKFNEKVQEITRDIKSFNSGSPTSTTPEGEQKLLDFLSNIQTKSQMTASGLSKEPSRTFKQAKIFNKRISDEYQTAVRAGDENLIGKYGALDDAMRSDVGAQISRFDDPKISSMFDKAETYFRERIVPMRTKEMRKFMSRDADTDTLMQSFLKTGQVERPKLLKQLTSKIPEEDKDALGAMYLTRNLKSSGDQIDYNPAAIANNYAKLKPGVKKILFNADKRKELDNLSLIMKKMGGESNQMFAPKTGYQWSEMAGHVAAPLVAVGLGAGGHAADSDSIKYGPVVALLGAIAAGRALSNPNHARRYIKSLESSGGLSASAQRHLSTLPFVVTQQSKDKDD